MKRRKRIKKNGFTLIEVVAVIAIIGIIAGSAAVSFSSALSKTHNDFCTTNGGTLVEAAKEYFKDYKSLKPTEIGQETKVTLETLEKEKYVDDDLKDYTGSKCNAKTSSVSMIKTTNNNYEYTYSMDCGKCNKASDNLYNKSNVKASIAYSPQSGQNSGNNDLNITISFNDNGVAIYSYKYEIYKIEGGKETLVEGLTNYKKYNNKDINVKLNNQGTYKIKTTVINAAGNKTVKESGNYKLDYNLNECSGLKLTASYQEVGSSWKTLRTDDWHKGAFNFNVTKTGDIYSYDVYLTIDDGREEKIVNKATSNKEFNYGSNLSHTYKFRVVGYDEKGNKCDLMNRSTNVFIYKQDNIPPRCVTSGGNGTSNNSRWLNSSSNPGYVKIVGTTVDDADGGNRYINSGRDTSKNVGKDANGYAIESGNAVRYLTQDTNEYYSPGVVTDKAGNSTVCDRSEWVQIDKTAPSCEVSSENTGRWINKSDSDSGMRAKVYGTCVDSPILDSSGSGKTVMSGCDSRGNSLSIYGTEDIDKDVSPPDVHDIAGNTAKCTGTVRVKVDKTAPTCYVTGTNTDSWLNANDYNNGNRVTVYGRCTDRSVTNGNGANIQSGCNYSISSRAYGDYDMDENVSPGTVYDAAGNGTTCGTKRVMVDRTYPTCTNSGDSTDWTRNNRTINWGCSDANGCSGSGSKTFTTSTTTATINAYQVTDTAGNSRSCPSRTAYVYVDKCDSYSSSTSYGSCDHRCAGGSKPKTISYISNRGSRFQCKAADTSSVSCGGVYYKNGGTCSKSCGGGTYNRLAYSVEDDGRCPSYDEDTGGSSCNTQSCVEKNSCNFIGYTNRKNSISYNTAWPCSSGHQHRTGGYAHYCTDSNGNFKVAKSMGEFTWACPRLNISSSSRTIRIGSTTYKIVDDSSVSDTCITSYGASGCGGLRNITLN